MVSFPWLWSSREVTIKHAATITSSCGCLLIRRNRSNDCRLWQGSFLLLVSYLHIINYYDVYSARFASLHHSLLDSNYIVWRNYFLYSSRNYEHLNLQEIINILIIPWTSRVPRVQVLFFVFLKLQVTTLRSWSNVCFLVSITNKLSLIKLLLLLTKIIIIIIFFFFYQHSIPLLPKISQCFIYPPLIPFCKLM